jgi:hypothetical protein
MPWPWPARPARRAEPYPARQTRFAPFGHSTSVVAPEVVVVVPCYCRLAPALFDSPAFPWPQASSAAARVPAAGATSGGRACVTPVFLAPNKSPNKSCVFLKLSN